MQQSKIIKQQEKNDGGPQFWGGAGENIWRILKSKAGTHRQARAPTSTKVGMTQWPWLLWDYIPAAAQGGTALHQGRAYMPEKLEFAWRGQGGLLLSSLHTHCVAIELCQTCKEYTFYYLFISMASVHLNFHASFCLHVIVLYMYLSCCSCLWSWGTKATPNSFSIIYFYKRTTVKINQRYAGFYRYFFNFGGYFSSYCSGFEIETLHCWESAMKI